MVHYCVSPSEADRGIEAYTVPEVALILFVLTLGMTQR